MHSSAPIDWSRKTVTQQKSDTEFRKRKSSDTENLPPTPVSAARTSEEGNSSNAETDPRKELLPNNPSSSYSFGRGDKPRVRLYATGGPLPGIRSAEDQKSLQQMYELIKSELMAREKLRAMDRIDEDNLRAGVAYVPESIEVSSPPTTSSSHHSSRRHQTESEEVPPARIPNEGAQRSSSISSTSGERESGIPISTRFMYHFPRTVNPSPTQSTVNHNPPSLPLVRRNNEEPNSMSQPVLPPPAPLVSRPPFPPRPDLTLHSFPDNNPSGHNNPPDRRGDYYQPLPVTRSHLIIHSNERTSTPEPEKMAVHEQTDRNSSSSRFVGVPMSKRDFTISYPSSYHYASHQFMNLMPRKMTSQIMAEMPRHEPRHQSDHPGNEIKLRATVEVKDQKSGHVPELVVGRWISNERMREDRNGAYGDRVTSNIPAIDDITHRSPDCKEEDIMHRESTSPQTFAPEISTTTITTEAPSSLFPLPQAAALVAPDPMDMNHSPDPDYMLDDSYEMSGEANTTASPSVVTEKEQESSTSSSVEDEEEDDDDDDLSDEIENGSINASEELMEKPLFHEGTIRDMGMEQNTSYRDQSENSVTGSNTTPMILDHQVSSDVNHYDGNNDDVSSAWK